MSAADGVQPAMIVDPNGSYPVALQSFALQTTAVAAGSTTDVGVFVPGGAAWAVVGWRVSVAPAAAAGYVRLVSQDGTVLSEDVQFPTTGVVEAGWGPHLGGPVLLGGDAVQLYASAACSVSVFVLIAPGR